MKMLQYCSVCKAEYEMEVVPTGDDDGVLWLQCPACKGYLPKVRSAAGESRDRVGRDERDDPGDVEALGFDMETEAPIEAVPADEEFPETAADEEVGESSGEHVVEGAEELSSMDLDQAVPYRPWQTYEVGAVLHHLAWDDYGVVLAKETLPGNRHVVKVRFQEAGMVRLREDDES